MSEMTQREAQHAKPSARRDHLWVLAVIAGFALFDVWESWTQVGDKSGFAHGTGWTLTVIVEAYACYALFAWFGAPGVRSRRFAMWSAFAALALSLIGQGASVLAVHAIPPVWVRVFVRDLPVVVLALIAVLIHLRRLDREDAAEADERSAGQAQADTLRAELADLRSVLATAQSERDEAQQQGAEAAQRAGELERKLAAKNARNSRAKGRANQPRNGSASSRAAAVPADFDARAEALLILADEPRIRGAELGPRVGKSKRWGQMFLSELAKAAPSGGEGN